MLKGTVPFIKPQMSAEKSQEKGTVPFIIYAD